LVTNYEDQGLGGEEPDEELGGQVVDVENEMV